MPGSKCTAFLSGSGWREWFVGRGGGLKFEIVPPLCRLRPIFPLMTVPHMARKKLGKY